MKEEKITELNTLAENETAEQQQINLEVELARDGEISLNERLKKIENGGRLENHAVWPENISYWKAEEIDTEKMENLFDKTQVTKGGIYLADTLGWGVSSVASQSDWILAEPGDVFRVKDPRTEGYTNVVYKNAAGIIFSGEKKAATGEVLDFIVPPSAVAISVAFYNDAIDTYMIVKNTMFPTTYLPFEVKNFFDKMQMTESGYFDGITKNWIKSETENQSGWIKTIPGDIIRIKDTRNAGYMNVVYKNEAGGIFSGEKREVNGGVLEFTTPSGAVSASFSFAAEAKNTYMVIRNAEFPAEYIEYNPPYVVNLFDKTKVTFGGIYQADTLTWGRSSIASQSDWIDAKAGDVFRVKDPRTTGYTNVVYKNADGVIFAGEKKPAAGEVLEFIAPAGAAEISIAFYNGAFDTFMIVKNTEFPIDYIPYNKPMRKKKYSIANEAIKEYFTGLISSELQPYLPSLSASVYQGKKLSILGDSISTFAGYIPGDASHTYYTGSNCGVSSVNDTWWKKTMDALGMTLCVNNSWTGTRVTTVDGDEKAGCMARCQSLHTQAETPDVIIAYMGTNDLNYAGTQMGVYDSSRPFPTNTNTFREAYAIMLNKILTAYPDAEVWVGTLMQCERQGEVEFPERNPTTGVTIDAFNNIIREMADLFGVKVIDFNKCGITYQNLSTYTGDYNTQQLTGLHPNAQGHSLMANQVIRQMDNAVRTRY